MPDSISLLQLVSFLDLQISIVSIARLPGLYLLGYLGTSEYVSAVKPSTLTVFKQWNDNQLLAT